MFAKFICWMLAPLFNNQRFIELVVTQWVQTRGVDAIAKDIAKNIYMPHLGEVVADTLDMDEIKQHVANQISAHDLIDHLDMDEITEAVKEGIDVDARAVANEINLTDLAGELKYDEIAIDYDKMAHNFSISDLANEIDLSDLAGELDYSRITDSLELDYSEIASNIEASDIATEISTSDIAAEVDMDAVIEQIVNNDDWVDYTALAKALIRELGASSKVEVRASK